MGSSFFKPQFALDPLGNMIGKMAGPNSWFAKMSAYDPIISSGVGKVIAPAAHNVGVAYTQRHTDMNPAATAAAHPTPYAGVDPTLQGANGGYTAAAAAAAQRAQQPQGQQPQAKPLPFMPNQQAQPYGYGSY